jgi:hypothetical protein
MILRNLSPLFALVTGLLIISCTPYPENQPQPQPTKKPAANETMASEEQQKLRAERKKAAEEAEERTAEQEEKAEDTKPGGTTAGGGTTPGGGSKPAERKDWPFASPVPGKSGFVFSPYNNKVIDVRDMPSGVLVRDPTYAESEKKYFRVP